MSKKSKLWQIIYNLAGNSTVNISNLNPKKGNFVQSEAIPMLPTSVYQATQGATNHKTHLAPEFRK